VAAAEKVALQTYLMKRHLRQLWSSACIVSTSQKIAATVLLLRSSVSLFSLVFLLFLSPSSWSHDFAEAVILLPPFLILFVLTWMEMGFARFLYVMPMMCMKREREIVDFFSFLFLFSIFCSLPIAFITVGNGGMMLSEGLAFAGSLISSTQINVCSELLPFQITFFLSFIYLLFFYFPIEGSWFLVVDILFHSCIACLTSITTIVCVCRSAWGDMLLMLGVTLSMLFSLFTILFLRPQRHSSDPTLLSVSIQDEKTPLILNTRENDQQQQQQKQQQSPIKSPAAALAQQHQRSVQVEQQREERRITFKQFQDQGRNPEKLSFLCCVVLMLYFSVVDDPMAPTRSTKTMADAIQSLPQYVGFPFFSFLSFFLHSPMTLIILFSCRGAPHDSSTSLSISQRQHVSVQQSFLSFYSLSLFTSVHCRLRFGCPNLAIQMFSRIAFLTSRRLIWIKTF
jgi:hypothetical protein